MRRVDQSQNACPIARSLNIFGDGWSLLIIRDAFFGKKRFGEFQESLGVAKNILSARLKMLVDAGIMEPVLLFDGTSHSEYELTEKGRALKPVLGAIREWGNAWCELKGARKHAPGLRSKSKL